MGQEDKSFNIDEGVTFDLREVLRDAQEGEGEGDKIIEKIQDFIFKLVMRQVKFPDSFSETEEERLKYFSKVFLEMVKETERKKIEKQISEEDKKINLKLISENIS